MLLFPDGSTTRAIYSALTVEQEGTMSSLLSLCETIEPHGLFSVLYTDRGSHYFFTPKAGGKVDKRQPTQVGGAGAAGDRHIASHSSQRRGRMERVFGTLQRRLPPELRRAGITTAAAANRWLCETFVADCNGRFAKSAAGTRHGIRGVCRTAARGCAVRASGSPDRPRQLRAMGQAIAADPAAAPSQHYVGRRCVCRIPQRQPGDLRRAALPHSLRPGWHSAGRRHRSEDRLNGSAGPTVDLWTTPSCCPQPHHRHIGRSGHIIRYQGRTSSRGTDSALSHRCIVPVLVNGAADFIR
jgi:hypothetical protein